MTVARRRTKTVVHHRRTCVPDEGAVVLVERPVLKVHHAFAHGVGNVLYDEFRVGLGQQLVWVASLDFSHNCVLDKRTKLRISWRVCFGPSGSQRDGAPRPAAARAGPATSSLRRRPLEVACTVSRKSKKREVFADGVLLHSGGLGLSESVGDAVNRVEIIGARESRAESPPRLGRFRLAPADSAYGRAPPREISRFPAEWSGGIPRGSPSPR